jgi:hypothetical protein
MDFTVGNPPWINIVWNESGVLGDANPLVVLRKLSASELANLRKDALLNILGLRESYLLEFESTLGMQNFLNAMQNYPELQGMHCNLYKCFLPLSWRLSNKTGIQAFVHPEGVYDDPNGGKLREFLYKRLRYHFQFQNELCLFAEVDHHAKFSLNICGPADTTQFIHMANLYHPSTVDMSFESKGLGDVPGIKNDENNWHIKGHSQRLLKIGQVELELFAILYDKPGTPAVQARLPALHANNLVNVLQKFASYKNRLGNLEEEIFQTNMWHETNAQQDLTIRRQTCFPQRAEQWVLSGPHFFVGNPCYKTPRSQCVKNSHYDVLDLEFLSDNYLPRTNYIPAIKADEYLTRIPVVPWDVEGREQKVVTGHYRFVNREMLSQSGERTFISAIVPKDVGHVNTCFGIAFKEIKLLLNLYSSSLSIVVDYRVKSTGVGHANKTFLNQFPLLASGVFEIPMFIRALSLTCLTNYYTELWEKCFDKKYNNDIWLSTDQRLPHFHFKNLTSHWTRTVALRTDSLVVKPWSNSMSLQHEHLT